MMAHDQASGAQKKTSIRRFDITDKSYWPGKALQTSAQCRPRCAARWPGSATSRGRGAAPTTQQATFVLTLLRLGWSAQSARHLTTHNGTKIDVLAVAPKTVGFWVDQASLLVRQLCTLKSLQGSWEAIRPLLVSGKLEGWSLWHRNVLVKLVSRGIWTQERLARLRRGRRQLPVVQRWTRHHVPPLL